LGDVYLQNSNPTTTDTASRTISLVANTTNTAPTSIPSATLSLAAGKTIFVGGGKYSGNGAVVPYAPILRAGPNGVTITRLFGTGGPTATFTAGQPVSTANSTNENAARRNAGKTLTLGSAGIEITNGTLEVAPEATFVIADVTVDTKLEQNDTKIGFLSVADGGKISLSATSSGTPTINIGDTKISWTDSTATTTATSAVLAASGGTVVLGNNTIEGPKDAVLAVTGNDAAIDLEDRAGTPVGAKSLTIKGATLDLATRGELTIEGQTSVNKLILTDGGKLNLYNLPEGSTAVAPDSALGLTKIGTILSTTGYDRGDISGDAVPLILSTNSSKTPRALSLAHDGKGSSVNITGLTTSSGDVVLNRSSAFSQ
jgi:hypothetical protein